MSVATSVQDAAIGWLVELSSGEADEGQRQAFARWLAADARHPAAWRMLGQAVEHSVGPLQAAGGAAAVGHTLARAARHDDQRRQWLQGVLCLAGAAFGGAWLLRGSPFLPDWSADLHTATARRGRYTLADGSVLTLDARSSADTDVRHEHRQVALRQGQLLARVAPVANAPFVLRSAHGTVTARGGELMLRREARGTVALAVRGDLDVRPAGKGLARVLRQGQAARFDEDRLTLLPGMAAGQATAWEQGMLVAVDERLGDVVAALRPYRHGYIDISAQAAALRVSGNYSLDDSGATLLALAETLPLTLRQGPGGWWTGLDLKTS
ncbi:FecR domain-containing protein [Janthinobacterium sp. SUN098]|uniref:FecR family protein n=1 Tax=Janthinobacterium sp. SUN098 TaxID=3002437 RepID=UPI0038D5050E